LASGKAQDVRRAVDCTVVPVEPADVRIAKQCNTDGAARCFGCHPAQPGAETARRQRPAEAIDNVDA